MAKLAVCNILRVCLPAKERSQTKYRLHVCTKQSSLACQFNGRIFNPNTQTHIRPPYSHSTPEAYVLDFVDDMWLCGDCVILDPAIWCSASTHNEFKYLPCGRRRRPERVFGRSSARRGRVHTKGRPLCVCVAARNARTIHTYIHAHMYTRTHNRACMRAKCQHKFDRKCCGGGRQRRL